MNFCDHVHYLEIHMADWTQLQGNIDIIQIQVGDYNAFLAETEIRQMA